MKKLTELCLYDAREGLLNKDFTSKELVLDHIEAMESSRSLNAFITETPEIAIKSAENSDLRFNKGTNRDLEGIPIGVLY